MAKIHVILVLAASVLQAAVKSSWAQQESVEQQDGARSGLSLPRAGLEKLANLTQDDDSLWILLPANLSDPQLHGSNFSLFKLNTRALLSEPGSGSDAWARLDGPVPDQPEAAPSGRARGGRKLNLFRNVLGKPQVSPLYLVNGTVCRFVNAQPICTTLSTTGLFRGQNPSFLQPQQQQQGGLLQGINQQQQLVPNIQQQPSQRQLSPQQMQQGGGQVFRPSAILDDEQRTVALVGSNSTPHSQQAALRPSGASSRPAMSYVVRRPLNLLALSRPFRSG